MLHTLTSRRGWLLVAALTIAVLAMGAILPARVAQAINTPWLSVSGRFIMDPSGNTVILREVSLIDVSVAP